MAQQNALTDVRILFINGFQIPGLLTLSETGVEEDPIEVPEGGFIRLIGSGMEKIPTLECSWLVKRESTILQFFKEWRDTGKNARDVVLYFTDKSGKLENAYRRDLYSDSELGNYKDPAFDQGARDKTLLNVTLFPYEFETTLLQ